MEKKPMSENERKGLEILRKAWKEMENLPPAEKEELDRQTEAMMNWLYPEGHVWHRADEDDEVEDEE